MYYANSLFTNNNELWSLLHLAVTRLVLVAGDIKLYSKSHLVITSSYIGS